MSDTSARLAPHMLLKREVHRLGTSGCRDTLVAAGLVCERFQALLRISEKRSAHWVLAFCPQDTGRLPVLLRGKAVDVSPAPLMREQAEENMQRLYKRSRDGEIAFVTVLMVDVKSRPVVVLAYPARLIELIAAEVGMSSERVPQRVAGICRDFEAVYNGRLPDPEDRSYLAIAPCRYVFARLFQAQRCKVCDRSDGTVQKCAGCLLVRYCSRQCQVADWKAHKKECAAIRKTDLVVIDTEREDIEDLALRYEDACDITRCR